MKKSITNRSPLRKNQSDWIIYLLKVNEFEIKRNFRADSEVRCNGSVNEIFEASSFVDRRISIDRVSFRICLIENERGWMIRGTKKEEVRYATVAPPVHNNYSRDGSFWS